MFKLAIVVDAQVDFMDPDGALYVQGADQVTPILDEYLSTLTLENGYIGVLFTADTHDSETYPKSKEAEMFPPHCYKGTDGFDFAINPKQVPEGTPKFILNKGVFNMWEEPELKIRPLKVSGEPMSFGGEKTREEFFQDVVNSGIDEVEVTGVAADYCVKWAVEGLVARGFKVTLYDNLTAGIERDIHQVVSEEFAERDVQVL